MPATDNALLEPEARQFYCETLGIFERANVDILVGGAYAFARYTHIERHTKDFDIFVHERDFPAALDALAAAGYETDITFPHWLGKAFHPDGEYFVDVIYGSGNGVARVDDEWFTNAPNDLIFDVPVRLCPPEEMIWSKAFIQERERYDGADVAHLLKACGPELDWRRLLRRFGQHWHVLLSHLVLFNFIYPGERDRLPGAVVSELTRRLNDQVSSPTPTERVCRGTLLSRQQYLVDIETWGYLDVRTRPDNPMSDDDIATWTAGIARDGSKET